jgi:hypothetical protein
MSHHHDTCCQPHCQHNLESMTHHGNHDVRHCSCHSSHAMCSHHDDSQDSHAGAAMSSPFEILDRRFAKGKIDAQEYQERKSVLSASK